MHFTVFTDYAFRVLIYLALEPDRRVTINDIAESYSISKNHLMKVVSNLTRLKFVVAQRGPGGGIKLNRLPEDISLNEVVSNTEKHLQQSADTQLSSDNEETADTRLSNYLHHALQAYLDTLGRFTLADVLESKTEAAQLLELNEQAA